MKRIRCHILTASSMMDVTFLLLSVLSMANPSNTAPINTDTAVNAECTSYCVNTQATRFDVWGGGGGFSMTT